MTSPRKIAVFLTLLFGMALSLSVLLFVGGVCCAFFGLEGAILSDLVLVGVVVGTQTRTKRVMQPMKRFGK